jgi:anaerobic ribonucleoside-triphosphate reductase
MSHEEILKKVQQQRRRCTVYTRVMGYHRPVESFNIGKKGEHQERKQFKEQCA